MRIDRPRLREWTPVLLVWSCLLLLPFARLVELPVALMGLWVLAHWRRYLAPLRRPGATRDYSLAFALVWVPALLSLPDAYDLGNTLRSTAGYLRFYLAGLFVLQALTDGTARQRFLRLSAWLLLFWLADALIQAAVGVDLFGHPYPEDRLNGLFGDNLKFGPILAMLAPLLLIQARRHWPPTVRIGVWAVLLLVLLLAGSRAGWVMFAVVVGGYLLYLRSTGLRPSRRWLALAAALLLVTGTTGYQVSERFAARWDQTLELLEPDRAAIDWALSFRLDIWQTALAMIRAHPVNGVGARNFRHAYADFARPDDRFLHYNSGIGALHAHQLLLDAAAETGLIGLAGMFGLLGWLGRCWWRAGPLQRERALPYALAVLAALFPFNSHYALFSSLFAQLLWWTIALYLAALTAPEDRPASDPDWRRNPHDPSE
ncbi:MAG: O-antigen ligase family protein [Candidatus Competibacterales bacterium]|nr:O-antigen ligase family protein [Candidatus Competibacterales bacterium]